ncbi:hypothetical protein QFZ53_002427 [Microbacterium natoriense]|uniref:DUF916 domain-containing protein n=1 Tax=Microbacterium natoriense TaxID=284570 RepID=A0AAW8EY32_9MICO|nr:hypothetical protein [Microbacterium natoriense]MDQ0648231.1 hypothetical protein [Microbacterium natoriense]
MIDHRLSPSAAAPSSDRGAPPHPSARRRASARSRGACLLTATLIVLCSALVAPPAAHAADDDAVTWGVTPSGSAGPDGRLAFEYQVAPGSVVTDWVAVTNESASAQSFRVYAADAKTDYDTAAFTLIGAEQASTDLGAWTSVDEGQASCPDTDDEPEAACVAELGVTVTVEPGSRVDIPFTITVPHDARPGDHSAGIVASYASTTGGEGTTVQRENRVGARIYLRVDGALSPGFGVNGLVTAYDGALAPFTGGIGRVGFEVSNLGNTRVSARPVATLTGPFGVALGTIELEPVRNLVPGGVAHVSAELPGVPPALLLFAEVTVTPVPADGAAAGDPLPAALISSAVTWAVPWSLVGVIALLAAAIGVTVWRRRRSRALLAEELVDYADRIRAEHDDANAREKELL